MRRVNQLGRIVLKSALVLTLLAGTSSGKIQAENNTVVSAPSIAEQYLLAAANRERLSRGLRVLQQDPVLARAAAFHARQMAEHGGISHEFPGEPDLASRAATAGVHFSIVSENVAEAPEPTEIHDMWMKSEGHRENLLDPNVNVAGISVIVRDHQFYAVEDFASTVESLSFDQQESTVANLLAASGIDIANKAAADATIQDARETCAMSTGYAGARKPWFVMRYTASTLSELPSQLKTRLSSGKYHHAAVGACSATESSSFASYNIAVLLYP
jgi:uncharacterized protein YkwD